MKNSASFWLKAVLGTAAVVVLGVALTGCGSSSKKAEPVPAPVVEEKGSLSRTFGVVDEQGRKSGTLVFTFGGNATLRDTDGTVIGVFTPTQALHPVGSPMPAESSAPAAPSAPVPQQ